MSIHNISKNFDFKPNDNRVSPLGQIIRGHTLINFIVNGNLNSDQERKSNPLTRRGDNMFLFPKTILLIGICVNHVSLKHYF